MSLDLHACDPVSAHSVLSRVEEQLEWLRERLGPEVNSWTVIGCRQKMKKLFFEVDAGGRRIIGKVAPSGRAAHTYETLCKLREAGLRPPSPYLVTEPVGWFPERNLLIQAKAEGETLAWLIEHDTDRAEAGARAAGEWLRFLQSLPIETAAASDPAAPIERCEIELSARLPRHRERINEIAQSLRTALQNPNSLVPSHGDFHPMNIFVARDGRTTAIDVDTFGSREPAADVGYFLAEAAIMGGIAKTRSVRAAFLEAAPHADPERVSVHIRLAFLRSLHYDLCILNLKDESRVPPCLDIMERGLET